MDHEAQKTREAMWEHDIAAAGNRPAGIAGASYPANALAGQSSRERTIAEHFDQLIYEHESHIRAIKQLRDNLPVSFLTSGVSRVYPIFNKPV